MPVTMHIGPYLIEESLDKGGPGLAYKGFHEELGQYAVIRTLDLEVRLSPEIKKQVALKAHALTRLRHPNLAAIYGLIEAHDKVFIATEYVDGEEVGSLLTKIDENSFPLSLRQVIEIIGPILQALDYIHGQGVAHLNINPSVLKVQNGQPKLTDFGVTSLRATALKTLPGITLGDPGYMPPEEIQFQDTDGRADIYSMAAVLFEVLAGRRLFPGKTGIEQLRCHLTETPPELKALVPEIPPGISDAIAIALEKDPQLRFKTAADFLSALQGGVAGFLPVRPALSLEPLEESSADIEALPLAETNEFKALSGQRSAWRAFAALTLLSLGIASAFGLWKAWYRPTNRPQAESDLEGTSSSFSQSEYPPDLFPSIQPPAQDSPAKESAPTISKAKRPQPQEVAPRTALAVKLDPAQVRQQEIAKVRGEIQAGIEEAQADIETQSFDSAQDKLDLLMGNVERFPAELQAEGENVRSLRRSVNEALLAKQAKAQKERLQQEAWEQRLQQIQNLITQGAFPEAEKLARDLSQEKDVPDSVSTRARELQRQAISEIKKSFEGTQLGSTTNKLRKPPE